MGFDNAGETRRPDPSATKCSDHPLDQEEVSDPQLSAQRPRDLQHTGVRHQCWGHILPGNLLQPRQDLRERTEPEVWSLPHHWREARVSPQEKRRSRCCRPAPPAALPLPTSAISSVLDNVWSDKGADSPDSSWPERLSESGLGLGELASRVNKSSAEAGGVCGVQPFC